MTFAGVDNDAVVESVSVNNANIESIGVDSNIQDDVDSLEEKVHFKITAQ